MKVIEITVIDFVEGQRVEFTQTILLTPEAIQERFDNPKYYDQIITEMDFDLNKKIKLIFPKLNQPYRIDR